jgi:hypothetical protein
MRMRFVVAVLVVVWLGGRAISHCLGASVESLSLLPSIYGVGMVE